MTKKKKFLIIILILLTILVFIRRTKSFLLLNSNYSVLPSAQASNTINNISISVSMGGQKINLQAKASATFYDDLISAQKNNQITLAGKNYEGLGFMVTDIGLFHSGGGKYLLYYINGVEASVGVSTYVPKDGDVISWQLK